MGVVFLGMPGAWANHTHEAADHYTTKIGGHPDWPIPLPTTSADLLKCSVCKSNLCLLAQNAGLLLWRAIRFQKAVTSEGLKSESCEAVASPTSSIPDSKKDWKKDIWSFESDGDDEDIDLSELARALSEASNLASHSKKQIHGHKETAETSSLQCEIRANDENIPVLPCFYIYAEEEKVSKHDASICLENVSPLKDKEKDPDDAGEEAWEGEDYEYDRALNADRIFLKFKKRLDAYPEQCFRYSYGGKPLLASGDAADPGTCKLCGSSRHYEMQLMPPLLYFLREAVSEKEKHVLDSWNWMTLMVYSCSQNCSNYHQDSSVENGWIVAEEALVVQYE